MDSQQPLGIQMTEVTEEISFAAAPQVGYDHLNRRKNRLE
jgi:hypothetical protein